MCCFTATRPCLANLRDVTAVAKAAGVLSQVHCCGREAYLVEAAATRTDLSCIEPLDNRGGTLPALLRRVNARVTQAVLVFGVKIFRCNSLRL